jgi:DNA polymerase/3'-5' exonuclease PolX
MKKTKQIKQNSLLHHSTKTKKQTHNENILRILTLVKNYYKEQNDKIRIKTYDRAIYQIRKWNKPITHGSELLHLEGIGKGMVDKIDTIIRSGTLPILKEKSIELHNTQINKKNETEIQSILGFSKPFINEIKRKHNVKTINDFRNYIKNINNTTMKLTHIQELGLKYYEDLNDLIPRNEITYLGNQLKRIIENQDEDGEYGEESEDNEDDTNLYKVKVMLSGSYPSQTKKYSKDIDIIIVNTEYNSINHSGTLKKIISHIEKNFEEKEKEKDTESKDRKKKLEIISLGETKFMGLLHSPLSHKMRHIDIRMVNLEDLPYTWFYFSSGQIFNILIRKKLKQKGYKLNEYGLFQNKNNSKVKFDVYPEHKMEKLKLMFQKKSSQSPQSPQSLEKELLHYIEIIEREIFKLATMDYKNVKERY